MPSRATIEAAVPRCPKRPQVEKPSAGLKPIHVDGPPCDAPLKHYTPDGNRWLCTVCDSVIDGEHLGQAFAPPKLVFVGQE